MFFVFFCFTASEDHFENCSTRAMQYRYNAGTFTMRQIAFANFGFRESEGGVIYSTVKGTIINCSFDNIFARNGGAIYSESDLSITSSTFNDCYSLNTDGTGGAIAMVSLVSPLLSITFSSLSSSTPNIIHTDHVRVLISTTRIGSSSTDHSTGYLILDATTSIAFYSLTQFTPGLLLSATGAPLINIQNSNFQTISRSIWASGSTVILAYSLIQSMNPLSVRGYLVECRILQILHLYVDFMQDPPDFFSFQVLSNTFDNPALLYLSHRVPRFEIDVKSEIMQVPSQKFASTRSSAYPTSWDFCNLSNNPTPRPPAATPLPSRSPVPPATTVSLFFARTEFFDNTSIFTEAITELLVLTSSFRTVYLVLIVLAAVIVFTLVVVVIIFFAIKGGRVSHDEGIIYDPCAPRFPFR